MGLKHFGARPDRDSSKSLWFGTYHPARRRKAQPLRMPVFSVGGYPKLEIGRASCSGHMALQEGIERHLVAVGIAG